MQNVQVFAQTVTYTVAIICSYTVVWEKFTVGYFHVKIVRGKIFLSLGVSDENFFNNEVF